MSSSPQPVGQPIVRHVRRKKGGKWSERPTLTPRPHEPSDGSVHMMLSRVSHANSLRDVVADRQFGATSNPRPRVRISVTRDAARHMEAKTGSCLNGGGISGRSNSCLDRGRRQQFQLRRLATFDHTAAPRSPLLRCQRWCSLRPVESGRFQPARTHSCHRRRGWSWNPSVRTCLFPDG